MLTYEWLKNWAMNNSTKTDRILLLEQEVKDLKLELERMNQREQVYYIVYCIDKRDQVIATRYELNGDYCDFYNGEKFVGRYRDIDSINVSDLATLKPEK